MLHSLKNYSTAYHVSPLHRNNRTLAAAGSCSLADCICCRSQQLIRSFCHFLEGFSCGFSTHSIYFFFSPMQGTGNLEACVIGGGGCLSIVKTVDRAQHGDMFVDWWQPHLRDTYFAKRNRASMHANMGSKVDMRWPMEAQTNLCSSGIQVGTASRRAHWKDQIPISVQGSVRITKVLMHYSAQSSTGTNSLKMAHTHGILAVVLLFSLLLLVFACIRRSHLLPTYGLPRIR